MNAPKTLRSDTLTVAVAALIGVALLAIVLESADKDSAPVRTPGHALWPVPISSLAASARSAAGAEAELALAAPVVEAREGTSASAPPVVAAREAADRERLVREAMERDGLAVVKTTLKGSMPGSFRAAVGAHGDALAATWARLFMWDVDLRKDLWAGDTLEAAYAVDEHGAVTIAAAKLGSQRLRRELTAYRFKASGDAFPSYWAADGSEVALRLENSPIEHYEQVTSLLRDRPNHQGMDFMAPVGTPIVAPFAGKITRVNWNRAANGLCIELERPDGSLVKFLHLDRADVTPGTTVKRGQTLGTSGNTGRSTGPHLHYQINHGKRVLDPVEVHGTRRRTLPASDRAAFAAQVERLDAVLGR